MNMEIVITLLLAYLAAGIATCNLGPWARKRKGGDLMLAAVLLWPAILVRHCFQPQLDLKPVRAAGGTTRPEGLSYARMKGVGILTCGDCEKHYEALSYTQGDGWSRGYQCQTCGSFEIRSYKEPFARPNPNYHNPKATLADIHPVYRLHRIEHTQSMIRIIENGMQTTPRNEWMKTWEPNLARYREELSQVTEAELARVKKLREEADAAFEASLVCGCGGTLDREKILFCPACQSTNLSYTMQHIT
jgi:hypothetical protein